LKLSDSDIRARRHLLDAVPLTPSAFVTVRYVAVAQFFENFYLASVH